MTQEAIIHLIETKLERAKAEHKENARKLVNGLQVGNEMIWLRQIQVETITEVYWDLLNILKDNKESE